MNFATFLAPFLVTFLCLFLHFIGAHGFAGVAAYLGLSTTTLWILVAVEAIVAAGLSLRPSRRLIVDFIRQPPVLGPVFGWLLVPLMLKAQLHVWHELRAAKRTRRRRIAQANEIYGPLMKNLKLTPAQILASSAKELGRYIRDGECTSVELTAFFLRRIEIENPRLNAVVFLRDDAALRDAKDRDTELRRLRNGDSEGQASTQSPFFGVPTVIKECMEFPDMPYSAGVWGRRQIKGQTHATAMHRLVDLGGMVVMGSTNVSEACMWFESYNGVYGVTKNPYDPSRTPGGSSGGIGASVAAGFCPLAVGSDVGGSIRIPASYCCLFGHKASGGLVPNTRTMPICTGNINRFCQIGPLATHSEDLLPLLRILAGPDGECPKTNAFPASRWPPHPFDAHKSTKASGCKQLGSNAETKQRSNLPATVNPHPLHTHERTALEIVGADHIGPDLVVLDVAELSGGNFLASRIHPEQVRKGFVYIPRTGLWMHAD